MKSTFNTAWKSSKRPAKQRKYRAKAPAHVRQKFVSVNLSKTLRSQHNTRSVAARVGDTVKVLRGQFRGKSGAVERINRRKAVLYIQGVELTKKDGSKTSYPINPSNVQLQSLDTKDKRRFKEAVKKGKEEKKAAKKAKKVEHKAKKGEKKAKKPSKPKKTAKSDAKKESKPTKKEAKSP